MPPHSAEEPPSTLGIKPPQKRKFLTVDKWLEYKSETDEAEGLWRVHDGIYDFSDFIKRHPGGAEWIELSKGLDITEAFEVHHVSSLPEEMLKKYFVRKARKKRNSPFTFKDDGFYRTLKREAAAILPTLPKNGKKVTDFFIDSLLVIMFSLAILGVKYSNLFLVILSGNFMGLLTIAAHNYLHQKDNFRMYYFNFSLLTVREWRISHVLSHHMHTNTIDDFEIIQNEPFLLYLPVKKDPIRRYGQLAIAPLLWATGFHRSFLLRIQELLTGKAKLKKTDLVPFILPIAIYLFSGQSLGRVLLLWNLIIVVASTHLLFVGLHAAHHHPEIFHDGDEPRSRDDYDWGISQLDAVMDRKEITGSPFLVLTNFGDHALHHLFPTLDHSALELLYPVFKKVLAQFDTNLRMVSQMDTIYGGFQQLIKDTPSQAPPNLKKYDINKVK